MTGSELVTLVRTSSAPCSSSTASPMRNCSRSVSFQSTPMVSPICLASSRVNVFSSDTICLLWLAYRLVVWVGPSVALFDCAPASAPAGHYNPVAIQASCQYSRLTAQREDISVQGIVAAKRPAWFTFLLAVIALPALVVGSFLF